MKKLPEILIRIVAFAWVITFPIVICIGFMPMFIYDGSEGVDRLMSWWGIFGNVL